MSARRYMTWQWRESMPSSGVVAFPPSMPSKPERSARPVRPVRRGYFPLPRTAAEICVRTVRNGPAIRFQVIAADGPGSTASVYRPPPGNWQSRWSTRDYLLRGQCGRCGRSRPDVFWRTGDREKAVPALGSISAVMPGSRHQCACSERHSAAGHGRSSKSPRRNRVCPRSCGEPSRRQRSQQSRPPQVRAPSPPSA
jgi:hypothetical protein